MKVFNLGYEYDSNPTDCEVCGTNYNESHEFYINDELIWFRYETGCYGGDTSDEGLLTTIIKYIFNKADNIYWEYWLDKPTEEQINRYIKETIDHIEYLTTSTPHQLIILKAVLESEFEVELNIIDEVLINAWYT